LATIALDFGENWGVTRRLREDVEVLGRKRDNLVRLISEGEKSIKTQEQVLERNEAALAPLRWLNGAGVDNQTIVDIHRYLSEQGDAQGSVDKVELLGGL